MANTKKIKLVWVLCTVDNFGQINLDEGIYGMFDTKEEAVKRQQELIKKYGPYGTYEVRQMEMAD